MQTFLPYSNFVESAKILDYRRLGKQRVEGMQILNILNNLSDKVGWRNHPAVRMWREHRGCLKKYTQVMIDEWKNRGYKNNINLDCYANDENDYPSWIEDWSFHIAHQSNLVRKQLQTEAKGRKLEVDYRSTFKVSADLPYVWPC